MFVRLILFILFVYSFNLINCYEDDWSLFENSFKHHNREEIFISNVTTDKDFKLNVTVEKWVTLNAGSICYTGGITNNGSLVILLSTLSNNGTRISIEQKLYDLEEPISNIEFIENTKNGNQSLYIIAYSAKTNTFIWYSLKNYATKKIWTWPMQETISYFNIFKMNKQCFLIVSNKNAVTIYGLNIDALEYWIYQSIKLGEPTTSLCLTQNEANFYLSITQPTSGKLLIYQSSNQHFTHQETLTSNQLDQVICFENGFKSFVAFNGHDAGIYEFTNEGLKGREIANSNLEGIQFWLSVPIDIYKDESLLFCQRKLDHDSHFSFDVDVVTYNGRRFEEHEDVPCSLFGEHHNNLKCLTEFDADKGMLGSSYIRVGNHLALIVPSSKNSSILFNLEVGLKKIEHPAKKELEELQDLKKELEILIADQKKITEKLKKQKPFSAAKSARAPLLQAKFNENREFLKNEVANVMSEVEEINEKVKEMQELKLKGKYDTVIFNGPVIVESAFVTTNLTTEDEDIVEILSNLVRRDNMEPIQGHKTFTNLSVQNISFENVNNISKNEFLFLNDEIIGNITFESAVDIGNLELVSGVVNDVEIDKWVNVDKLVKDPITFDQMRVRDKFEAHSLNNKTLDQKHLSQLEKLTIPGNVTVENLNKHNFEGFLRKLCINNATCHLPSLKLKGAIDVKENATIKQLNGLNFPEDYIDLDPKEKLTISGNKQFTNITRGYKATVNGTVNNIDLAKIVSLSGEENINGTVTFSNLEVVSDLNVLGNVKAEKIEKFLPNIGLKNTTNITANVSFLNLEVLGDIVIQNTFNNTQFNTYLNNIILKDEQSATITAVKSFPQGFTTHKNLQINSGLINNISLSSIITKDTDQLLNIDTILGNVDFDYLNIKGFMDGQNITKLNETLIRTFQNQTIISELIFEENLFVEALTANKSSNNNNNITDLLSKVNFKNVIVEGNFEGNIIDFDLKHLEDNYLQYTFDQTINQPYFIDAMKIHKFKIRSINNVSFDDVFAYDKFVNNVTDLLSYRNASVDVINVKGALDVKRINDEDFNEILDDHVWNKLHKNSSRLTIDNDVFFETLNIENLAGADFDDYIDNLVFKNDTKMKIDGPIYFKNGLIVDKLIETSTLNNISLKNILRKSGNQTIAGPIDILGNATIEDDVTIKETINRVELTYILENFELGEETLLVKGEVLFNRLSYIQNLTIDGLINGQNFTKLQNEFIHKHQDIHLLKNITFNNTVHIKGNLGVKNTINSIVLSDFVPRVVWLTKDAKIDGPIRFIYPVVGYKYLNVESKFSTALLLCKDLQDVINEGVFINTGLLNGSFHFENLAIHEDLRTKFVNSIDMDTLVPLKTPQQLNGLDIVEMSVANDFNVGNSVNDINLMIERDRTLLSNVKQYVPSEIVFLNNVMVEEKLEAKTINKKPISKIVTTNTDQNLTASYNFNSKTWSHGQLTVNGLINGINITLWKRNAISFNSEETLHIKQKWHVMENLNLAVPLHGQGMVNDINITQLAKNIEERELYLCDIEIKIMNDFSNICKDITNLYEHAKHQIYKFKYFEALEPLVLPNDIHFVKHFQFKARNYLLINEKQSCFSKLLKFNGPEGFLELSSVHTGVIDQIEVLNDKDILLMVSRGSGNDNLSCNIRYSMVIWKLSEDEGLQIVATHESQELLHKKPNTSNAFYGLKNEVVTEFKINASEEPALLQEYKKWNINEANARFIPFGTGISLASNKSSIFLDDVENIADQKVDINVESTIVSNFTRKSNHVIPGRGDGEIAAVSVGVNKKKLLALAGHKETQVEHRLDVLEIYSNPFTAEIFDKLLTYRPTALTSINFNNGETLLTFMENQKTLQIYEYKGIEGFKHRSSIKIQADQIIKMNLGFESAENSVLGLIYKNKITFLQAIMAGSRLGDDLNCAN